MPQRCVEQSIQASVMSRRLNAPKQVAPRDLDLNVKLTETSLLALT